MGPTGAVIMSFFGGVFLLLGLKPYFGLVSPIAIIPVGIAAAFILTASWRIRQRDAIPRDERAGKVIGWSSAGEGIGIFVAINLCNNLGLPQAVLPAVAIVVALHFVPMAYFIPFPRFYGLAAALLVASAVGLWIGGDTGWLIAGAGAACALWAASLLALLRRVPQPA